MKRYCLPVALLVSLLLNIGFIGAVVWTRAHDEPRGHAFLAEHLGLDAQQLPQWRAKEEAFLADLQGAWQDIKLHRERMIAAIFVERLNEAAIEEERLAIARLQERQQRAVIRQMMDERDILTEAQRIALARFLIEQYPLGSFEQALAQDSPAH